MLKNPVKLGLITWFTQVCRILEHSQNPGLIWVKSTINNRVISIFQEFLASFNKILKLVVKLGTRLSFYDSGKVSVFKVTATEWLPGRLTLSSFWYLSNEYQEFLVVKAKLPPYSNSVTLRWLNLIHKKRS